jgi:hypothetical protein
MCDTTRRSWLRHRTVLRALASVAQKVSPRFRVAAAAVRAIALALHCRDQGDYSQYVVGEYPIYQMYGLLTPRSFRARLAQAIYVDAKSEKAIGTRTGLFLDGDDDLAQPIVRTAAPPRSARRDRQCARASAASARPIRA